MRFFDLFFKRPPVYSQVVFESKLDNNVIGTWDEINALLKKTGKDRPRLVAPFEAQLKNKISAELLTQGKLTREKASLIKKNVNYLLTCRPDLVMQALEDKNIPYGGERSRAMTLNLVAKNQLWKHYYQHPRQWPCTILNHFGADYICQKIAQDKAVFDKCLKNRAIRQLLIDDLRKTDSPFRNIVRANPDTASQWLLALYERAPQKWPISIFQALAQPACTALLKASAWQRFRNRDHLANRVTGEQLTKRLLSCATKEEQSLLAKKIFSRRRDFLARIKRPVDWAQLLDARVDGAGTACDYYCRHLIRTDAEYILVKEQIHMLRRSIATIPCVPKTPAVYLPLLNLNDRDDNSLTKKRQDSPASASDSTPLYNQNKSFPSKAPLRRKKLNFSLVDGVDKTLDTNNLEDSHRKPESETTSKRKLH